MNKKTKFIYGVSDKTGGCPFYTGFFDGEPNALKELEKQMDYVHLEYGMDGLSVIGNNVYCEEKVIFSIEKFKLN